MSTQAAKHFTWIGSDHPPGWRRVGQIDVADPADTRSALDRGYRIGTIYDGGSDSAAEPCAADIYAEAPDFVDQVELPGYGQREWIDATVAAMRAKGATFFRASHPLDKPDHLYMEGWLEVPAVQGPHPWELGQ